MIELPNDVPGYMADAWYGCLMWAVGEDEIVAEFSKQTGCPIPSRKGGIDAMIDRACGLDEVFAHKFAKWFHENVWGKDTAPTTPAG